MREIKFRAKRIDNREWVYGFYVNKGPKHQIVTELNTFPFQVDPETVGQFTSLKDKDGKEIYEGDICRTNRNSKQWEIIFENSEWTFSNKNLPQLAGLEKYSFHKYFSMLNKVKGLIEITGNIHDSKPIV